MTNGAPRPATSYALLFFAAVLLLLPIWAVHFPPLVDYPNHLARGYILAHLHDPALGFDRFYQADWGLYPYLTADLLLIGLNKLLPIALAGKVLLTICLFSVPLGAWAFLRRANPGEDSLAVWSLVVALNAFFLYGWLSYQLSLGLCFLALAVWLGYMRRPSAGAWLGFMLLATLLYFTHLLGFAVAGLVVTLYALLERRLRDLVISWVAFVPGAIFFLLSRTGGHRNQQLEFRGMLGKVLVTREALHSFSRTLDAGTALVLVACALALWVKNPEFRWNKRWLTVALVAFALYWVFPAAYAGGTHADVRLLIFVFVLALASVRAGRRGRVVALVIFLLFAARTANLMSRYAADQADIAMQARAFTALDRNARVLPIMEDDANHVERYYMQVWGYGIIERGWYVPYLFHLKGVQPIQLKTDSYRPDGFWSLHYAKPPDWQRVRADYDYVWAYDVPRFDPALSSIGETVFSEGKLKVYRLHK